MAGEIKGNAARGIASLTRTHRQEYGVHRAHMYALYAINLALFTMLEHDPFDILDEDFLVLASAFTIVAARSSLGRSLFHIFRQTVRSKAQGSRIRHSAVVPDELKELFDESAARGSSRWDDYAEGLHKLNRKEKYGGICHEFDSEFGFDSARGEQQGEVQEQHAGDAYSRALQAYPGLGLCDMLDRYESLSLGKDELLQERRKPDGRTREHERV